MSAAGNPTHFFGGVDRVWDDPASRTQKYCYGIPMPSSLSRGGTDRIWLDAVRLDLDFRTSFKGVGDSLAGTIHIALVQHREELTNMPRDTNVFELKFAGPFAHQKGDDDLITDEDATLERVSGFDANHNGLSLRDMNVIFHKRILCQRQEAKTQWARQKRLFIPLKKSFGFTSSVDQSGEKPLEVFLWYVPHMSDGTSPVTPQTFARTVYFSVGRTTYYRKIN